jgi:hypothetical protein
LTFSTKKFLHFDMKRVLSVTAFLGVKCSDVLDTGGMGSFGVRYTFKAAAG